MTFGNPDRISDLFLDHSNRIEGEYTFIAFEDAIDAWNYMKDVKKITPMDILMIHELLLKRIHPNIAGRYRSCDVYIGGKIKKFKGLGIFQTQMEGICRDINKTIEDYEAGRISRIRSMYPKTLHVKFEDIHPFEDGNGRTGRIIYNWHREMLNLPIHVIREGEEQREYYKWFK